MQSTDFGSGYSAALTGSMNSITGRVDSGRDVELPSVFRSRSCCALLESTPGTGHVIQIIHAATLFAAGALQGDELHPEVAGYIASCADAGLDTLYVVGVWKTGGFSRLVMPHFASEWESKPNESHIGPSVFSIAECIPNKNIGSWEALERVSSLARERYGITLVFDFVPNTTAIASGIIRNNPDLVRDWERPVNDYQRTVEYYEHCEGEGACIYSATFHEVNERAADVEHQLSVYSVDPEEQLMVYSRFEGREEFTVYLQRNMRSGFYPYAWIEIDNGEVERVCCKQLGSDGYTYWADVLMLETDSPALQRVQAEFLKKVSEVTPIVRADMSHLPRRQYWSELAEKVAELGGTMPEVWGEAYGVGVHDELAQQNIHSYANFLREWLTQAGINVPAILQQLYHDPHAREFYSRGMSVGYTANHDDDLGQFLLQEGAASTILCAMPVAKVMLAQGQRHGDTHRYGADQHVPMEDYKLNIATARQNDPGYAAHMDRLTPLMARDVFRSPHSDWKPAVLSVSDDSIARIFHVVRSLGDDRVVTIVDCQSMRYDRIVEIDVSETFAVRPEELPDFAVVDLLFGSVQPAAEKIWIPLNGESGGYSSHVYALVRKDRLLA